jgi:hypothetical protein
VLVKDLVDGGVLRLDVLRHPGGLDVDGGQHRAQHRDESGQPVDHAEVDHRHTRLDRQSRVADREEIGVPQAGERAHQLGVDES